jgi:hypothetical protein
MEEMIKTSDRAVASLEANGGLAEAWLAPHAIYHVICIDKDGNLKWEDSFQNTVMTLGKNDVLNKYFSNTAAGASFLGLISSSGYSAIAAADTMASHAGWTEAGNANAPTYTAPRKTLTAAWSAASAGSMSTAATQDFAITGSGTVKGAFINIGGVSTVDNTTGLLYSAGLFSAPGDRVVANGDTLKVTVTLTAS